MRSWVGRGPDGRRMCKLCGLTGGDVTRIKNHIESVHWPHSQGYACEQCSAICKTRHALACHKSRHHPKNKTNAAGTASKRGAQHSLSEPVVQINEESAQLVSAAVMASPEVPAAQLATKRDSRGRGKRASKKS